MVKTEHAQQNIAIIHDWFPLIGGAERVVQAFVESFPDCSVYCLFDFLSDEERAELVGDRTIHTSRLNRLPLVQRYYRYLLLQCTREVEWFDLRGYDAVLSSSAALAKGVITAPGQPHLAYVHSPARYAWDLTHDYMDTLGGPFGVIKRRLAHNMMHRFRMWDMRTPHSIDLMIANSNFIAKRIHKIYRRRACVVYPPVNTERFVPGPSQREDFYLTASRLVPYKKIDLIVRAFSQRPDRRLVVIGDGPEMAKVKQAAGPNVEILGYQSFEVLLDHMQRARAFVFAAHEDFGIVPVEAQACGTPVISLALGGTAETVRPLGKADRPTGTWFYEQTEDAILTAVSEFEADGDAITAEDCRANALFFGAGRFNRQMKFVLAHGSESGFDALLDATLPE